MAFNDDYVEPSEVHLVMRTAIFLAGLLSNMGILEATEISPSFKMPFIGSFSTPHLVLQWVILD